MRRNHQPYHIHRAGLAVARWYTRRFLAPHFEAFGDGGLVFKPWFVRLHGPAIRAGRFVHIIGERGRDVRLSVWSRGSDHGAIEIGSYSIILPAVRISSATSIRIGAGCMIASGAYLTDADWHGIVDRTEEVGGTAPIVLEDNVWIADGAFVGKGVTVGANSIVGAHAVVTKDVPPDVIVAGNPARVVRELDPSTSYVTRATLFDASPDEIARRQAYVQAMALGHNGVGTWLRTLVAPRRGD